MKEWMCNREIEGFTKGLSYKTNKKGSLIDDDGDSRLSPVTYNSVWVFTFLEIEPQVILEN